MWAKNKQSGFTIVELLIVIVVIGILAAITIVAYNGIQVRARDTQRSQDMAGIIKALELYKVDKGAYPPSNGTDSPGSNVPAGYTITNAYGRSYATNDSWLKSLVTGGYIKNAPKDPINTMDNYYSYYVYPTGVASCPEPIYVLQVQNYEAGANIPKTATTNISQSCDGVSTAFITSTTTGRATFSNIKN